MPKKSFRWTEEVNLKFILVRGAFKKAKKWANCRINKKLGLDCQIHQWTIFYKQIIQTMSEPIH